MQLQRGRGRAPCERVWGVWWEGGGGCWRRGGANVILRHCIKQLIVGDSAEMQCGKNLQSMIRYS